MIKYIFPFHKCENICEAIKYHSKCPLESSCLEEWRGNDACGTNMINIAGRKVYQICA